MNGTPVIQCDDWRGIRCTEGLSKVVNFALSKEFGVELRNRKRLKVFSVEPMQVSVVHWKVNVAFMLGSRIEYRSRILSVLHDYVKDVYMTMRSHIIGTKYRKIGRPRSRIGQNIDGQISNFFCLIFCLSLRVRPLTIRTMT